MTKKETITNNIEITFDFLRELINSPEKLDKLPAKCEIDFIEKDYSNISEKDFKKKKIIRVSRRFEYLS
jgi:hypothetical protein